MLGSAPASAAVAQGSGFLQGFTHPVVGLDHALAIIAVGIIAGLIGGRALWLVPAAFVACMAAGALWGIRRIDLPYFEIGIAASVVVFGAVMAFGRRLPIAAAAALAGVFAVFHGYAHGTEAPLEVSVAGYFVGFLLAAAVLMAIGIGIEAAIARLGEPNANRTRQVAGAAIALAGVGFLAGWL